MDSYINHKSTSPREMKWMMTSAVSWYYKKELEGLDECVAIATSPKLNLLVVSKRYVEARVFCLSMLRHQRTLYRREAIRHYGRMAFSDLEAQLLYVVDRVARSVHCVDICSDVHVGRFHLGQETAQQDMVGLAVRADLVAVNCGSDVFVFHRTHWTVVRRVSVPGPLSGMSFSQDGSTLAVAAGRALCLISSKSGGQRSISIGLGEGIALDVHQDDEGTWLVGSSKGLWAVTEDDGACGACLISPSCYRVSSVALVPRLGLATVMGIDNRIVLCITPDMHAMAAMSEGRLLWMSAVSRGGHFSPPTHTTNSQ